MWKQPNNSTPPVASDKPLQQTVDTRVKTTTTSNISTSSITPTTSSNPTITMVATTLTSTPSTSITTAKHTPITTSMPTVVIPTVPMCTPSIVQVVSSNTITTNPTTPIATKRQPQPTIVTPPPQVSVQQAPLALTTQTSRSPQPAHQQPPLQTTPIVMSQPVPMISLSATNNRPPSSLTIISKTPTNSANIKQEPSKVNCSLLDNGIKCDRVATNASFSARIQKIVATKKLDFALDPSVRHAYICEYHKGILTVAKKSAATPKDNNKSNARNYNTAHNNVANTLNNQQPQPMVYQSADLSMMPGVITQHPVSIVPLNNQGRIAMNNHVVTPMNNIAVRPAPQVAYTHYPGPQATPNQQPQTMANMDVMSGSFDMAGGDAATMGGPPRNNTGVDVDLQQLQVNTLRRYKKHFRVQTRPGLNKMQLAEVLKCHFRTLPIIEKEAITYFVYIAKCYLNKLDHVG